MPADQLLGVDVAESSAAAIFDRHRCYRSVLGRTDCVMPMAMGRLLYGLVGLTKTTSRMIHSGITAWFELALRMVLVGVPQAFCCHKEDIMKIKIGLYGIGLDTYWNQFDGLLDRLQGWQQTIADKIIEDHPDVEVVNTGIVDNPTKAREVGQILAQSNIELILLYVSTYALSSTVLPVVLRARVPVIVLNLQATNAIDYEKLNQMGDRGKMTGEWLSYCQACSAPEIASVFNRANIPYHMVTGTLKDPEAWKEISEWVQAIQVTAALRESRVGAMGHYYCGMLDVYSDLQQLSVVFGVHFELLEMCELVQYRQDVTPEEETEKLQQFRTDFIVDDDCDQQEISRAAVTSVALDKMVAHNGLDSLAYYYEGQPGNEYENIVTSIIPGNTLLTMHHVPVAGEYEIKNVIAMKIMDLMGCGGSFSEFYAMDFNDDAILLGHDGPAHAAIAEGKVRLVPLPVFHGKPGQGLSIQMSVKHGPITILSVVQDRDGQVKLSFAEGACVPGPIMEIGNTNSRYRFAPGIKEFMEAWSRQGPSHHMAIGIGHVGGTLEKIGHALSIEAIRVC